MITLDVIKELLQNSAPLLQQLNETYALLPPTQCRRQAHCCSLLPETTLVEALVVIRRLTDMPPAIRQRYVQKIIRYFFINPVEITSCPFIKDQDCLIYNDRFWGCRTYGLWSQAYYEKLAGQDRQAKVQLQQQWKNLGISLPQKVVDFQVPYCRHVEMLEDRDMDDKMLLQVSEKIETLSEQFSHRHQSFRQQYYSDLSFLLSTLVFGFTEAVKMKFSLVSDIINTGSSNRLDQIIKELPDLMAELV